MGSTHVLARLVYRVMPQNVDFHLPFPLEINPNIEGVRTRNVEWVQRHRLVTDGAALAWYTSWDMAKLAAYGYPYAEDDELDLCADTMAFFFLFDDQFDGDLGRDPGRVAAACQELIDIVHGTATASGVIRTPCGAAFADIWARSCDGASPAWIARTAHEWEYYFASYAHEAINRCAGVPQDRERFMHVRRGISGTALPVSIGERVARIDVSPSAFHSPQLRIMREIVTDVTFACNDVFSVEKEAARGDVDNLVLVIEHERRCSRAEAVAEVCDLVHERSERFQQLTREVPELCATLGLTPRQRADVLRYAEVMAGWIRGYHEWEAETLRYTTAGSVVPDSRPGYFDELLEPVHR
jgi:avermitilol synthase